MFTRIIVATSALALSTSAVLAADLVYEPAPQPVEAYEPLPVSTWSGFSLGVHGGYTEFTQDATTNTATGAFAAGATADAGGDGILGGVQLGYDHQVGPWVLGAGFDFSWTDADGSSSFNNAVAGSSGTFSADTEWVSTLTGRLGHEFTPGTLAYVEGGVAWQDVEYKRTTTTGGVTSTATNDDIRTGYVVGGGLEHMLTDQWSVNAEYNYLDFGDEDYAFANSASTVEVDSDAHLFKLGLNYRFGTPGY